MIGKWSKGPLLREGNLKPTSFVLFQLIYHKQNAIFSLLLRSQWWIGLSTRSVCDRPAWRSKADSGPGDLSTLVLFRDASELFGLQKVALKQALKCVRLARTPAVFLFFASLKRALVRNHTWSDQREASKKSRQSHLRDHLINFNMPIRSQFLNVRLPFSQFSDSV